MRWHVTYPGVYEYSSTVCVYCVMCAVCVLLVLKYSVCIALCVLCVHCWSVRFMFGSCSPTTNGDRTCHAHFIPTFQPCTFPRHQTQPQVPFPKPPQYKVTDWELLRRYVGACEQSVQSGDVENAVRDDTLHNLLTLHNQTHDGHCQLGFPSCNVGGVPGGKADMNNCGGIASDFIGGSWTYPEATYADRKAVWCVINRWFNMVHRLFRTYPEATYVDRKGVRRCVDSLTLDVVYQRANEMRDERKRRETRES